MVQRKFIINISANLIYINNKINLNIKWHINKINLMYIKIIKHYLKSIFQNDKLIAKTKIKI